MRDEVGDQKDDQVKEHEFTPKGTCAPLQSSLALRRSYAWSRYLPYNQRLLVAKASDLVGKGKCLSGKGQVPADSPTVPNNPEICDASVWSSPLDLTASPSDAPPPRSMSMFQSSRLKSSVPRIPGAYNEITGTSPIKPREPKKLCVNWNVHQSVTVAKVTKAV